MLSTLSVYTPYVPSGQVHRASLFVYGGMMLTCLESKVVGVYTTDLSSLYSSLLCSSYMELDARWFLVSGLLSVVSRVGCG